MVSKRIAKMEKCDVHGADGLAGKKWSLIILQQIVMNGDKGFNFIFKKLKKISPKILSKRLKEMEEMKLIKKEQTESKPARIKYAITKKGSELYSIMMQLKKWKSEFSDDKEDC